MSELRFEYGDKTIQEFVHLFEHGQLNLEPGFQRDSVWTLPDRKKLIQSIFQNYPIPSVFLYKRSDNGRLEYDVIDGKQRLESIFMFQGLKGFRGLRFEAQLPLGPDAGDMACNWRRVQKKGREHEFMGYKIQTVEICGELSDIIDLFVRINSTGKRLTGAEKRHARYYHSDFLKRAAQLAEHRRDYFLQNRILSPGQISRMKHVELVCELVASLHERGPINKKDALDAFISGHSFDRRSLSRCVQECVRGLNLVARMFSNLRETRFRRSVDFYSLFLLVWEMDQSGYILNDRQRNRQAQTLLTWLSNGVDIVRQQVKKARGATPEQQVFVDYLLTVQSATDNLAPRKRRAEILRQLLGGVFEKKDEQRGFTQEQRRLIWNSNEVKKCSHSKCNRVLSWENFTVDHITPHALGGRTELTNAQLMCRKCNSRKGARRRGRPRSR